MSNLRLQIGKAVRRLRTAAGYSQEGFADACKLHRTYIGAIERGEKNLTTDTIERIAATLHISVFELVRAAERD